MTKTTSSKSATAEKAGTSKKPAAIPKGVTATNSSTPGITGAATSAGGRGGKGPAA